VVSFDFGKELGKICKTDNAGTNAAWAEAIAILAFRQILFSYRMIAYAYYLRTPQNSTYGLKKIKDRLGDQAEALRGLAIPTSGRGSRQFPCAFVRRPFLVLVGVHRRPSASSKIRMA
jgi:hypothetical protein